MVPFLKKTIDEVHEVGWERVLENYFCDGGIFREEAGEQLDDVVGAVVTAAGDDQASDARDPD
jgi:hypothetical protein